MNLYIVYKILNLINENFYIGVHKTKDINDGYMGSGILIRQAIDKYGLDNFKKEILFIYTNKKDAYNKERELVTDHEVANSKCYNLKEGGCGGFDHIKKMCKDERHFCYETKKIYHPITNEGKTVKVEDLSTFLENGWVCGFSPEHRLNLSESSKLKIQTVDHRKKNSERKRHSLIYKKDDKLKWLLPEEVDEYVSNGWSVYTKICKHCKNTFVAKGMPVLFCSVHCRYTNSRLSKLSQN